MDPKVLSALLNQVRTKTCSVEAAIERLAQWPFAAMEFANVDHHRALRCGFGEVVFGEGKTVADMLAIVAEARRKAPVVLVTRVSDMQARALRRRFRGAHHNPRGKVVRIGSPCAPISKGTVVVVSAGTSDRPVAEEALETLRTFGARSEAYHDVGVAGLHRLLHRLPRLRQAAVLIAVAGMEGALPSVVGGLVACPVIAVPTSIGYGASFNGVAALLAMLNSCAAGVSVVNIDNGFGAAAVALRILKARRFR